MTMRWAMLCCRCVRTLRSIMAQYVTIFEKSFSFTNQYLNAAFIIFLPFKMKFISVSKVFILSTSGHHLIVQFRRYLSSQLQGITLLYSFEDIYPLNFRTSSYRTVPKVFILPTSGHHLIEVHHRFMHTSYEIFFYGNIGDIRIFSSFCKI